VEGRVEGNDVVEEEERSGDLDTEGVCAGGGLPFILFD